MFVSYSRKGDRTYARLVTSRRVDGKVVKETSNLGRVVDRRRNVFRSRERGTFTFDPGTGEFGPAPAGGWPVPPERLVLDFGDAWALDSLATSEGLWGAPGAASPADPGACARATRWPPAAQVPRGRLVGGQLGARRLPLGPPRVPARERAAGARRRRGRPEALLRRVPRVGRRHGGRHGQGVGGLDGAAQLLAHASHGDIQPQRRGQRGVPPHLRAGAVDGAAGVPAGGRRQRRRRHHSRAHLRRARGRGTARVVGGARRGLLVRGQRARHGVRRDQVPHQAQAQREALQEGRRRAPGGHPQGPQPRRPRRAPRLRRQVRGRARAGRARVALPVPGHAGPRHGSSTGPSPGRGGGGPRPRRSTGGRGAWAPSRRPRPPT